MNIAVCCRGNDKLKVSMIYSGLVSITLDSDWKEPLDENNPSDVAASNRAMHFKLGWFAHPIFVNGDYPEEMKERVAAKSAAEGLAQSRLPEFTAEEKAFIVGRCWGFQLHNTLTLISLTQFSGRKR